MSKRLDDKNNFKHLAKNPDVDVVKIKTERNSLGALKTLIVLLLVAVQLAVFIISPLYFLRDIRWVWYIAIVMTIITCLYVLSSNKNSQSKPVWILFLILCFSFGYVIYFISHERIFWGNNKKKYDKVLKKSYDFVKQDSVKIKDVEIKNQSEYLKRVGNFSTYTNTKSKYFSSGASFFDSVLEDIKNAKDFIFIEYFIISDGVLLKRFLSILEQKVREGVDVRIIYDDLGSHKTFKRKTKRAIKNAGIKLQAFNKVLPKMTALLNYRDHRKIVSIDGKIAYTGGANLADEYTNEKRMHGYWKDAGIRLEGPAVDGLTLIFLRQWEFVSKENIDYNKYLEKYEVFENESAIIPYADGLEYTDNIGKNVYTNMIANANKKLYIMSPYFVIDDTISNLLINKAKSGVDVRIILPEIADKKFVYIISRNTAEKLTSYGVKLYTMKNSFVHSKVMLNDNSAVVGSINMDLRSFYQQFESAVFVNDKQTLMDINQDFNKTFENSVLIEKDKLKRNKFSFRLWAGVVNIISPFM